MWLLNTSTLELELFDNVDVPPYAILSHTWGDDELTFQKISNVDESVRVQHGFSKVENCCKVAATHDFRYVWIDTCCIDKESSAELSEAINSMYKWYQNATVCIIYLADVLVHDTSEMQMEAFRSCKWFTRGWTLQELLANSKRIFYGDTWSEIDTSLWSSSIDETIHQITGIEPEILADNTKIRNCCVAQRMSWAALRITKRPEDIAYCLLGLFNVNMAILYGEGEEGAFRRLQDEIMKISFDQSLFAWRSDRKESGLLARSPKDFQDTPQIGLYPPTMLAPILSTNVGILFRPSVLPMKSSFQNGAFKAALQCDVKSSQGWLCLVLWMKKVPDTFLYVNGKAHDAYRRVHCEIWEGIPGDQWEGVEFKDILVLEDSHYDQIQLARSQHNSRRDEQNFGVRPLIMSTRNGDSSHYNNPDAICFSTPRKKQTSILTTGLMQSLSSDTPCMVHRSKRDYRRDEYLASACKVCIRKDPEVELLRKL